MAWRIGIALGALMLIGAASAPVSVIAQDATTAPTASAPVDPAKLDLAHQLIELSGGQKQYDRQLKSMFGAMQSGMSKYMPPDQSKLVDSIYQDMDDEMSGMAPELLDMSARVYAQTFTEKELRDLIAFRNSDTGRSTAEKMPIVQAALVHEMIPMIMAKMPAIMQKTLDRVCAEKHCTAEQRQIVSNAMSKAMQRGG